MLGTYIPYLLSVATCSNEKKREEIKNKFQSTSTCMFNVHCRGFVNRSAIGVGVWRFVEGSEHGRAIRDGGSTSLPSFRSRNGGETLRAAIIHYMATSARLQ
jgi:hypothetical protein